MNYPMYITIMAICLIGSAYFSATETAFSCANKTRLKALAEAGNKRAAHALELSERYDRLISTVLIGNNIVNILLASLSTVLCVHLCGDDIGATISTVVTTIVVLIFGEITPKNIAKDMPERFAMFSTPLIQLLIWIFLPLVFLFSLWKKLISKVFKSKDDTKTSQEELIMMVEEVEQEGSIDEDESNLLKNAIEFTERRAEDILTHRVDLAAVNVEDDKKEISKLYSETKFSRLLVYEENIDNIIGVIHQKDFYEEGKITDKPLREIMSEPFFIQQNEKINDLMKKLQQSKSHMAVVLDEYGGTYGIVTLEDILEELVGEIWDEHDEVVEDFKELAENTWRVDCTVNIDDFFDFFELPKQEDVESVSLGGWVMEQLEKIPEEGDAFSFDKLDVTVTELDSHRVAFVKVFCNAEEEEEEDD
ncbi:MAG: HlyC/CorC family transporter [Clostridia bacterium]|nr:HlyC/CorC family transporter [Clostridia bacterium]